MKKLESGVLKMGKICYNANCTACSTWDRLKGNCIYSDGCSEFRESGFGSAKKKTNFDHIREDISLDDFVDMFAKHGCPPGCPCYPGYYGNNHKTCQSCWKQWLESEYHN